MAKKAKAAAAAPAATVQVEALEDHTGFGNSYKTGQKYSVPAEFVDSLEIQGKAIRTDEAAVIPGSRAMHVRATAVEPMGIDTTGKGRARKAAKAKTAKRGTYKRKDLRAKK